MSKLKSGRVWAGGSFFPEYELRRREIGNKATLGWETKLKKALYSSLLPCNFWDPSKHDGKAGFVGYGGVFNLEFSPDGSQLVAACERRAVLVFDPLSRRQIHCITHAHENCVNCIKFLDSRVFATCSDDSSVALWDVRNLKRHIRLLRGHANWVKNVEYSPSDGMLVSSGFDGKILGWDINRYTEEGLQSSELFNMQGLMRMRLTPDCSKLIMCTTGGYLILVHNLSLEHLAQDLRNFKPNMYRLMQLSNTTIPEPAGFTHLFYAKRNRVEFISEFPSGNNAEIIQSLQVHPQGWCVLSRNTSVEETSEWSCVHDIQELESADKVEKCAAKESDGCSDDAPQTQQDLPASIDRCDTGNDDTTRNVSPSSGSSSGNINRSSNTHNVRGRGAGRNLQVALNFNTDLEIILRQISREDEEEGGDDTGRGRNLYGRYRIDDSDDEGDDDVGLRGLGFNLQFRFTSQEVYEALQHIRERREEERLQQRRAQEERDNQAGPSCLQRNDSDTVEGERMQSSELGEERSAGSRTATGAADENHNLVFSMRNRQRRPTGRNWSASGGSLDSRNAFFIRTSSENHSAILLVPPNQNYPRYKRTADPNHEIVQNAARLTHYIKEPNVGRGFIKELCFSSDGRLICSPYANGVRLMMFDENCSELSHCVQRTAQPLYDISTSICHSNCVVSTKFSPVHCLLVSGCLDGKIAWYQPVL